MRAGIIFAPDGPMERASIAEACRIFYQQRRDAWRRQPDCPPRFRELVIAMSSRAAEAAAEPGHGRVLYGIVSMRAMRAHWALHELGLDYRTAAIGSRTGQTLTAEYTRLNPRQKIPTLKDGDFVISESAAIVTYLGERYRGRDITLVPQDVHQRARYFEWISLISMELDATSLYVVRRHEGLADIYGAAPDVAQSCRDYYLKQLRATSPALADGRPYLLGDEFGGADILMTTCLDWGARFGVSLPDVFEDYRRRIAARPAYLAAGVANQSPQVPAP